MPSIPDAVADILGRGLPVVFLDACSIVDVIRGSFRHDQLAGCLTAGAELLRMATVAPIGCSLVVGSFVPREWHDHAQSEAYNLSKHLKRLDDHAADFHEACAAIGITPTFARPAYDAVGLAAGAHALSKGLLDSAIHLDAHNDTNMKAFSRAVAKLPPSLKGGEIKDSTIIEECLETSRQLQAAGFMNKRIFCTSNVNDYCEGGSLHPLLAADFATVGLGFVTNLPWAVHEVKTP